MTTKGYAEQVRSWRQEKPLPLFPVRARPPAGARPARSLPAMTRRLTGDATAYLLVLTVAVVNAGIGLFALARHFAG